MRKNKKLMLGAIAAMGVMAMGVGGVSTFAWFVATDTANITELNNQTNSNIRVTDHAESDALNIRLKVNWPNSFTAVDLTAGEHVNANGENVEQNIGGAYVIDGNGHVKDNTSTSVVKSAAATITLSGDISEVETQTGPTSWRTATNVELLLLDGKTVTVKLAASDKLRIATSLTGGAVGTGYVGAYDGSDITLGTATIALTKSDNTVTALTYTYAAADGSAFSYTDKLGFYYSVSPNSTSANSESTSASYGTLTAKI